MEKPDLIVANWYTPSYLWYEDEANGESGSKERKQRCESVGGVDLLFDHERCWNADQAQYNHVVHANTYTPHHSTACDLHYSPAVVDGLVLSSIIFSK